LSLDGFREFRRDAEEKENCRNGRYSSSATFHGSGRNRFHVRFGMDNSRLDSGGCRKSNLEGYRERKEIAKLMLIS